MADERRRRFRRIARRPDDDALLAAEHRLDVLHDGATARETTLCRAGALLPPRGEQSLQLAQAGGVAAMLPLVRAERAAEHVGVARLRQRTLEVVQLVLELCGALRIEHAVAHHH